MAKSDKVAAVAEIAEQFKGASAAVVTEYRGLSVPQISELRRSLGEGATYSVAKNTLTKLAAKEAGVEGLDELFSGPTAIAFIEGEPVVAAKAIKTFAKDNKALVIKGGYMDGRVLSIAEIETIADLETFPGGATAATPGATARGTDNATATDPTEPDGRRQGCRRRRGRAVGQTDRLPEPGPVAVPPGRPPDRGATLPPHER